MRHPAIVNYPEGSLLAGGTNRIFSKRLTPRSARTACGRDQRDGSKRWVIVVVALVEANASALIDPERRAGSRAESRRRGGHRVGEGHAEMQILAALEKHIAAQARHIDADALNREARAGAPGACRLRPRRIRDGHVCAARTQLALELRELVRRGRQQADEVPDL